MMRVCFIAQQSVRLVAGGPWVQAQETAQALTSAGVTVEWFNQWEPFDAGKYDLVHLFGANMMSYDIAVRLRQFGVPFVVSSIFFTLRSPRQIRLALKAERLLQRGVGGGFRSDFGITAAVCHAANAVLPNTTAESAIITGGFGVEPEKVHVVPNGVNARFANATPELFLQQYGIQNAVLNVGHIGSVRKNVLGLLKAMQRVDAPLVLIGKIQRGEYADRCLELAKKNPRVEIIEGVANDSPLLESAYSACPVFALPSFFETPGIAALEAGLAEATVVITQHGGTRDYFGSDGIYVNPSSTNSIANGINKALATPPSTGLRQRIEKEFLWERVGELTLLAYRRVLG
ncbi:MAG: glycosyltransferase family 4 protein [Chlorobi bacterium]|nr:glycosyltransferase family 4 protein [Chlorobiota bacterium]